MAMVRVELEAAVRRTFRVEQVAGMMDLRGGAWERGRGGEDFVVRHELVAEVPGLDEAWTIGAIVGPSGSGKTTLALAAFGEAVNEAPEWPRERAIVDVLGDGESKADKNVCPTVKEIARVLAAVGLGSVPTWLKQYQVLSAGERFRADLARALILRAEGLTQSRKDTETQRSERGVKSVERERVLVVDEFTSALDRRVAKTTSAALARLVRKRTEVGGQRSGNEPLRLVAVTCHADVLPWLAPDWVVFLASDGQSQLVRGQWPPLELALEIRRVPQAMWGRFASHHYLAGGLAASATCYAAYVEGLGLGAGEEARSAESGTRNEKTLVAFCAAVAALGWKKTKRITRLVVLPEFQGLGIGSRLLAEVASREAGRGNRVTITASHPAIVEHCSRSPAWRFVGVKKMGSTRQRFAGREIRSSRGRAVASFAFLGSPQTVAISRD